MIERRWYGLLSVLAALLLCLPLRAESSALPLGSISGTITVRSRVSRVHQSADPSASQVESVQTPPELSNVIVFVEPVSHDAYPQPEKSVRMDQMHEAFVPHVLPILVGTVVDFYNLDPYYHNVFSLSPIKKFDLGRYPKGQRRSVNFGPLGSVKFDQPGVVRVFCEIHSHMNAYIVVLTTPFFTVPLASGNFLIQNVPAGPAHIRIWHDRLGLHSLPVTIEPAKTITCNLDL